jgi:hypothetical protein
MDKQWRDGVDSALYEAKVKLSGTENKMQTNTTNYHNINVCKKCGGKNSKAPKAVDGGVISEAETKCLVCGHREYWADGFFESAQDAAPEAAKPSIMDRLKSEQVVSFKPQSDGTFRVKEKCDDNFMEYLTRDEMLQLAREIIDMSQTNKT